MKKKRQYQHTRWYHGARTANECRAYYDHPELVRAKRRPVALHSWWDDHTSCVQKTWKTKRRKQYRGRSSKIKHRVRLDIRASTWELDEFFDYHNIPYRLEHIRESRSYSIRDQVKIKDKYIPIYNYRYVYRDKQMVKEVLHQSGWKWTYKWVREGPVRTYTYGVTVGYNLTYWSDYEVNLDWIYN